MFIDKTEIELEIENVKKEKQLIQIKNIADILKDEKTLTVLETILNNVEKDSSEIAAILENIEKNGNEIKQEEIDDSKRNTYISPSFFTDKKETKFVGFGVVDKLETIQEDMLEKLKSLVNINTPADELLSVYNEFTNNEAYGKMADKSFLEKVKALTYQTDGLQLSLNAILSVLDFVTEEKEKEKITVTVPKVEPSQFKDGEKKDTIINEDGVLETNVSYEKVSLKDVSTEKKEVGEADKKALKEADIKEKEFVGFSFSKATDFDEIDVAETNVYDLKNSMILGNIYVLSATDNTATSYTMPIQNNLIISEDSNEAVYNSITFLGKFGNIHQYTKSSIEAISVSTSYLVESSTYTYDKIREIEKSYKKLLVPYTSVDDELNSETFNTKPPIINIVYCNKSKNGTHKNSFNNFFTYYNSDKELIYKNYVVTNLEIEKDVETYRYNTNNGKIKGVNGFNVKMSLMEVNPNYNQSFPSFEDYWNEVNNE